MKVTDVIARFLAMNGIRVVFGYQGGSVTHIIDSISRQDGIEYIQTLSEQGAAFAADAYARTSNEGIGIAVATNGPGATNLITGIANAYCDSVPTLFLTGQVPTFAMKGSNRVRQKSFQEIDIRSIVKPITKYCVTVINKADVIPCLQKAICIAKSDRPGPVLVDLPLDVQGEDIEYNEERILPVQKHKRDITTDSKCKMAYDKFRNSKKPIILYGGGIENNTKSALWCFCKKYRIPAVCSLMGLDKLAHTSNAFIGLIGIYGNRYANIAIQQSDIVFALGTRLDQRQTGKNVREFAKNAYLVHVDIDGGELSNFHYSDLDINSEVSDFLFSFNRCIEEEGEDLDFSNWNKEIHKLKKCYPSTDELDTESINPNKFLKYLGELLPEDSIVSCDVGQNQMWVAQSLRLKVDRFWILNSGGLGAMGYALPASIGAKFARIRSRVVAVMGDGGLQMNIQELQLISARKMPILIIIMNNHALGLIKDIHRKYYDNNFEGSVHGFSCPPLDRLAKAYGMAYFQIDDEKDFVKLNSVLYTEEPTIINVNMRDDTFVYPELMGMEPLDKQVPYKDA